MFHFKEIVGVPIYIRFRRSGKANHQSIKIFKNCPVLFENTPVAFINNNQVKMRRSKQLAPIFGFRIIDSIQNRWVSGKHNPGVPVILVGTQIAQRHIRQILLKIIFCLFYQRGAVSQKKNIRNPLAAAEYIG